MADEMIETSTVTAGASTTPEAASLPATAGGDPKPAPAGQTGEGAASGAAGEAAAAKPKAKDLAALHVAQRRAAREAREAREAAAKTAAELQEQRAAREAADKELAELRAWRKENEGKPPRLADLPPDEAEKAIRGYATDSDPFTLAREAREIALRAEKRAAEAEAKLAEARQEIESAGAQRRTAAQAAELERQVTGFVSAVAARPKEFPYLLVEHTPDEIGQQVRAIQAQLVAKKLEYSGAEIAQYLERQAKARYDSRAEREARFRQSEEDGEGSGVAHREKNGQGREAKPGNGRRDKSGQKIPSTPRPETEQELDARLREEFARAIAADQAARAK